MHAVTHDPNAHLPRLEALASGLSSIFRSQGSEVEEFTIIKRERNINASTFAAEVVTCRLGQDEELRLLCKYAPRESESGHGHRGGVTYEATVYDHLLQNLPLPTARFFGVHTDHDSGQRWLVLQHLDESIRVSRAPDPKGMLLAAEWIGRFHAAMEQHLSTHSACVVYRYDRQYYRGWARRTALFADHLVQHFSWLPTLCQRFEELAETFVAQPATIIHGEYYVANVLFQDGAIYPIDWESAAIGMGELDLASLIEGWEADLVAECILKYLRARWPSSPPPEFEWRLAAARLYWHFRWLGDNAHWTATAPDRRFEELHSSGERLGLI